MILRVYPGDGNDRFRVVPLHDGPSWARKSHLDLGRKMCITDAVNAGAIEGTEEPRMYGGWEGDTRVLTATFFVDLIKNGRIVYSWFENGDGKVAYRWSAHQIGGLDDRIVEGPVNRIFKDRTQKPYWQMLADRVKAAGLATLEPYQRHAAADLERKRIASVVAGYLTLTSALRFFDPEEALTSLLPVDRR